MTGVGNPPAGGGVTVPLPQRETWDPKPLARAILADRAAAPRAVIAAWKCLYWDQPDDLVGLAFAAVDDALAQAPASAVSADRNEP